MLTVNGALYKDVEPKDFYHYFSETAMVWKISPNKKRLLIVGAQDEPAFITGSYLTRESMFKNKKIEFDKWWEYLDPIVMSPILFNVGSGCALWKHPLAKNLRKSFPWKTNNIQFYGNVAAADKSMQNIASVAFGELYGRPKSYPSLRDGLEQVVTMACGNRFILDRVRSKILLLGRYIGDLEGNKILVDRNKEVFLDLFKTTHKIPSSQLSLRDHVVKEEVKPDLVKGPPIPMKDNLQYLMGRQKNLVYPNPGYLVYLVPEQGGIDNVEWRTYLGIAPMELPGGIEPGWTVYDAWGIPL